MSTSLVCTSVSGVASSFFEIGTTYLMDDDNKICTGDPQGESCMQLWTVKDLKIYALANDVNSEVLVTFE